PNGDSTDGDPDVAGEGCCANAGLAIRKRQKIMDGVSFMCFVRSCQKSCLFARAQSSALLLGQPPGTIPTFRGRVRGQLVQPASKGHRRSIIGDDSQRGLEGTK